MTPRVRTSIAAFGCALLLEAQTVGSVAGPIEIVMVQGEGAFNDAKRRSPAELEVELRDARGTPLASVPVTFTLPKFGAGGVFEDGQAAKTVTTNAQGRANTRFRPNSTEGRFHIRITTAYQGEEATALMAQTNTLAASRPATEQSKFGVKKLLLMGAAGAAMATILSTRGGSKSSNGTVTPTVTSATIGAISVGGPR